MITNNTTIVSVISSHCIEQKRQCGQTLIFDLFFFIGIYDTLVQNVIEKNYNNKP